MQVDLPAAVGMTAVLHIHGAKREVDAVIRLGPARQQAGLGSDCLDVGAGQGFLPMPLCHHEAVSHCQWSASPPVPGCNQFTPPVRPWIILTPAEAVHSSLAQPQVIMPMVPELKKVPG